MKAIHYIAASLVTTGITCGVLALTDCNATPAQIGTTITDGIALAGCVLSKVLSGTVDVASLLGCSSATEAFIVDVIDDFTAQHVTDAGLASAGQTLTAQQVAWLQQARTNAVAALAAKASSK